MHKEFNKSIEDLGYSFIEDEDFPSNRNTSIDIIVWTRQAKNREYYIDYLVGKYKEFELRLLIGSTLNDTYIYTTLALVDNEGNYRSYKEYDPDILQAIISLGFDRSGNCKYKYLNYDLNFEDEYIYKLVDKDYMDKSVKSIGGEVLDIFEALSNSKKLKALLK